MASSRSQIDPGSCVRAVLSIQDHQEEAEDLNLPLRLSVGDTSTPDVS